MQIRAVHPYKVTRYRLSRRFVMLMRLRPFSRFLESRANKCLLASSTVCYCLNKRWLLNNLLSVTEPSLACHHHVIEKRWTAQWMSEWKREKQKQGNWLAWKHFDSKNIFVIFRQKIILWVWMYRVRAINNLGDIVEKRDRQKEKGRH